MLRGGLPGSGLSSTPLAGHPAAVEPLAWPPVLTSHPGIPVRPGDPRLNQRWALGPSEGRGSAQSKVLCRSPDLHSGGLWGGGPGLEVQSGEGRACSDPEGWRSPDFSRPPGNHKSRGHTQLWGRGQSCRLTSELGSPEQTFAWIIPPSRGNRKSVQTTGKKKILPFIGPPL